jgi:gamma-glutamyl:cysteine ligase YbdK (ATP-grasp superfamily)
LIPIPFPWKLAALAALVLALGVQTVRVDRLKDDADKARKMATEARLEAGRYKSYAELCKAALGRQNDAIEALRAESAERLARADKAASDARAVAASASKFSRDLMNARRAGQTACERAEDVRARFLEGIK